MIRPVNRCFSKSMSVKFITIDDATCGQRLDNFLLKTLKGVPKTYIYRIIRKGEVRINKKRAQAKVRLESGDIVRIPPVRMSESKSIDKKSVNKHQYLLNSILFEDEFVMVINKPSGLAVHAGSGVQFGIIELLRELTNYPFLELVHRLDRATSGCLLLAKKRSALTTLSKVFATNNEKNNLLDKRYKALVQSGLSSQSQTVIAPLSKRAMLDGEHKMVVLDKDDSRGLFAKTRFHTIESFSFSDNHKQTENHKIKNVSLLEAKLFTGRTHQVRAHAAHIGCCLAGDEKYGRRHFNQFMQQYGLNRLFLHASQLSFPHPQDNQKKTVQAPLAKELANVLDQLKSET